MPERPERPQRDGTGGARPGTPGGATLGPPPRRPITPAIDEQLRRFPARTAVICEGRALGGGDLDARAGALARHLRRVHRIGAEDRVGLLLPRSEWMIVAILGVLRAGAAFVPCDPAYPAARRRELLRLAGCRVVIEDPAEAAAGEAADEAADDAHGLPRVPVRCAGEPELELGAGAALTDAAYVLSTSGSTGTPRAVLVEHRAIASLCDAVQPLLYEGVAPGAREVISAPFVFDAAIQQTLSCLSLGLTIVLASEAERRDAARLVALAAESGAHAMNMVASMLGNLVQLGLVRRLPASLRTLVTGGERVTADVVSALFAQLGREDLTIYNMYGPTENCVDSTCFAIDAAWVRDHAEIPIGTPLANTEVHVMDAELRPVPPGAVGEICVAGHGLARGYLGDAAATALRFVAHPLRPGERMYRTGDLGRWRDDGRLEFLGRADHQVKIRGYRIELHEIAAQLRALPGVRDGAVIAREAAGGPELVACVAGDDVVPAALRAALAERLPGYMVPSLWTRLEKLPLTHNGKLDLQALSAIEPERVRAAVHVPPRTATERALAAIWAEVLDVAELGVHDDFFALGGHSLRGGQIAVRVRQQLGAEIDLAGVLACRTIAELARRIDEAPERRGADGAGGATGARAEALPEAPGDEHPLSHAQERLWIADRLAPGSPVYHVPVLLSVDGLEAEVLARAMTHLIARHEMLRTGFVARGGSVVQRIAAPSAVRVATARFATRAEAYAWAKAQTAVPFALDAPPLLRVGLAELATGGQLLYLCLHHIIADGWSLTVLLDELAATCGALARGEAPALPRLPMQYRQLARAEREADASEHARYWERQLAGAPPYLALPADGVADRAAPPLHGELIRRPLPPPLSARLRALARRAGTTDAVVMLAVYAALLGRISGAQDLVIGVGMAGRDRAGTERLIGLVMNMVPIRVALHAELGFDELVAALDRTLREAHAHAAYSIDRIISALGLPRDGLRQPLINAAFGYQSFGDIALAGRARGPLAEQLRIERSEFAHALPPTAKFDLNLLVSPMPDHLVLDLEHRTELFQPAAAARFLAYFEQIAGAIAGAGA